MSDTPFTPLREAAPLGPTEHLEQEQYERQRRVLRSQKFVEQLRASMINLPLFDDPDSAPLRSRNVSDTEVFVTLRAHVGRLRDLAAPRNALPDRIAEHAWARIPFVTRLIMRSANYLAGPSRRQATLVAECIELLTAEIQRTRGRE